MIILTIRTDNPEAEVGLFHNNEQLAYEVWAAHRRLAETLHQKIHDLLKSQDKKIGDVEGIVCFKGPGSFTGLRIGLSVANALAYSLGVPIVGIEGSHTWLEKGITDITAKSLNDKVVAPEYGAPVHITEAKK
jgi:tRNA threonylcarbamoyladenosine biosynthesis protein TsaB